LGFWTTNFSFKEHTTPLIAPFLNNTVFAKQVFLGSSNWQTGGKYKKERNGRQEFFFFKDTDVLKVDVNRGVQRNYLETKL